LYPVHNGEFGSVNSFTKGKNSVYFKETWTEQEVLQIMDDILQEIVPLI